MMNSQNENKDIAQLISKHFLGLLDESEQCRLDEWLEEDSKNQDLLCQLSDRKYMELRLNELDSIDYEMSYKRIVRPTYKKRFLVFAKYAAVLLPFFIVGYILFNSVSSTPQKTEISSIVPGSARAELIADNGEKYVLGNQDMDVHLADDVSAHSGSGQLHYTSAKRTKKLVYNTLIIPRGGEFNLTLSDGTKIFLNSESKLRYPVSFADGKREVFLEGEAYFEVTKNEASPFSVITNRGRIAVLGTTFNVKAYGDEPYDATTLVSGKVSVNNKDNQEHIIKPGQQCKIDTDGEMSCMEVDVAVITAWRNGIFAFDNQRLEEVMIILQRWYDIVPNFESEALGDIRISGKIKRFSEFQKVLELIELTGDISFDCVEKQIYIKE